MDHVAPPASDRPQSTTHPVQSLARGLAVIRAFDADNPEMTLSDVARQTGLTRATARRFLLTLVELGYVRTDGKIFVLTARVLEIGYSFLSGLTFPEIAQPHLEALMASVGESTSASVLDDTDIVYVARVPTRRIMSVGINIGTRFPAYATSMGRVLLAALPEKDLAERIDGMSLTERTTHTVQTKAHLLSVLKVVREQGFALVDQELEVGLRSMAMPITDAHGRVIAAINVSGHAGASDAATFRARIQGPLALAAERISSELRNAKPVSALMTAG
jgi:IclR family pca regulon transcriptional regulator